MKSKTGIFRPSEMENIKGIMAFDNNIKLIFNPADKIKTTRITALAILQRLEILKLPFANHFTTQYLKSH